MIFVIKEHEPHTNIIDHNGKPWRAQKMFLDLLDAGFDCKLFLSSFDHWSKTHTSQHQLLEKFEKVELLKAPAYPNNSSIMRFVSGMFFALRFVNAGLKGTKPEHIFVSCPGFLIIIGALLLKLRFGCKVYIDVRDDWPGTLSGFFPRFARRFVRTLFLGWLYILLYFADQIVVPSENLLKLTESLSSKKVIKIPFLIDAARVPSLSEEGERRDLVFIGSLSTFFDYEIFNKAADYCSETQRKFHILGGGEFLDQIRNTFSQNQHVKIYGHVDYETVKKIASKCQIGLYPYRTDVGFENHETNKLTDYLTMGLYVFTTLPLEINSAYYRKISPFPDAEWSVTVSSNQIKKYGVSRYVGSYADSFIAAELIAPMK